jgi:hypothetical protein
MEYVREDEDLADELDQDGDNLLALVAWNDDLTLAKELVEDMLIQPYTENYQGMNFYDIVSNMRPGKCYNYFSKTMEYKQYIISKNKHKARSYGTGFSIFNKQTQI